MFAHLLRRTGVAVLAGTVAAAGLVSTAATPAHAADPVAHDAGLSWLVEQIGSDNLVAGDVTTTIEYVLSAQALGAVPDARAKSGIDAGLAGYLDKGDQNVAMAVVYYNAIGADPKVTPAGDLVAKLEEALDDTTGELTSYPYTYGQAIAARALDGADSDEAQAAYDFLVNQQRCANGGFNWGTTTDPVNDCFASVDETSLAILAIQGVSGASGIVSAAASWLETQQQENGAFGYTFWEPPFNFVESANSTGLAAEALRAAGRSVAAAKAATWVRRHQVAGSPCDAKLATEGGAIPADQTYIDEGRTYGIDAQTRGSWALATAQATRALPSASAPGTLAVAAPTFVKASSTATVKATGLAAGTNGCIDVAGKHVAIQGGATTSAAVALPAGTRAYPATVKVAGASAATTVVALARKKLPVRLRKSRVHRGARQHVKVAGLYRGESVKVSYGGRVVARGKANAKGVFRGKFKVRRSTGVKKVKVRGHFGTRKRTAKFRVVR